MIRSVLQRHVDNDHNEDDNDKLTVSMDGVVSGQRTESPLVAQDKIDTSDCEEEEDELTLVPKDEAVAVQQADAPVARDNISICDGNGKTWRMRR